jgi:hypothetical protein
MVTISLDKQCPLDGVKAGVCFPLKKVPMLQNAAKLDPVVQRNFVTILALNH